MPAHSDVGAEGFFPIPLTDLPAGSVAETDLYVQTRDGISMYLDSGRTISAGVRSALVDAGVEALFIPYRVLGPLAQEACQLARIVLADTKVPPESRAMVIRDAGVAVSRQLVVAPGPASIATAQELAAMTATEALESPESLQALVRLTYVTSELNKHLVNCLVYSMAVCAAMGMDDSDEILETGLAGLLFDIGMAKMTNELQTAALTGGESDPLIRHHVFVGRELLHGVEGIPARVHDAALGHHERWDGSGYPSGLAGMDIPPAARIAAVVDVYDGLMTDGRGMARMSAYEALKFMAQTMKGQFESEVIDALILGLSG